MKAVKAGFQQSLGVEYFWAVSKLKHFDRSVSNEAQS
jgi:hypothetical protein